MAKIKILSESLVGKISAGEVVERPASALKEFIENSIDAGAHSIHIYIKEYGIAEIKVIDDGEGISQEDVALAFQRHATSKIEKEHDLFNIRTLGFRGEALYSIAQVSKLRIITQHRDENSGTELYLVGGNIIEQKPAVTKGTTIEIRDLFFNTPVRKKFLKSPSTEKAHLIETVQNYALSYPEISFYLSIDGQEILNIPVAKSLMDRIAQIFGLEFIEKLKVKTISNYGYKIELFIGNEDLLRRNRSKQLIFVNRRPVKDSLIVSTLYKAFHIKDTHPQFLIFIELPAEAVDFNVHPAKKEVRFREPYKISQLIYRITESYDKPSVVSENPAEWRTDLTYSEALELNFSVQPSALGSPKSPRLFGVPFSLQPILELGNAIIAIAQKDGIVFLDYHAANERVNFEKILNKIYEQQIRLVFPQVINLNPQEYTLIRENIGILNELGIEAEDFGQNSIIIRAIPDILKTADIAGIIESIAFTLKEEIGKPDFIDIKRKMAATMACHSSLRANDKITQAELKVLLEELEKTSDPQHCPHGRPVKKFISLNEIKKWFLR